MKFPDYYDSLPTGGRRKLADALGVAPTYLYQIARGLRPMPTNMCWALQSASGAAVTIHEARPDVFGPAPGVAPGSSQERAA